LDNKQRRNKKTNVDVGWLGLGQSFANFWLKEVKDRAAVKHERKARKEY
jgi:hypothetical protein